MAPRVLLLRTPTTPLENDRYEAALTRASFRPLSVPVLETALENLERLSRIVRGEDDGGMVDGVIVTSARAVEACANAGANIDWRAIRFYVVGPATATALQAQLPNPPQDVRGRESGTAEQLARFIVHDATSEERLLYLTGDKNRETLSRVVREGLGEDVLRELRVYATRGVRDFESNLTRALQGEKGTCSFSIFISSRRRTGMGIYKAPADCFFLKMMTSRGGLFSLHLLPLRTSCLPCVATFQYRRGSHPGV